MDNKQLEEQLSEFVSGIEADANPALKATLGADDAYQTLVKKLANSDDISIKELSDILALIDKYEEIKKYGGHMVGWFEPGTPYGIDKLPKHKAFFDAGLKYKVRATIAANRVGKSQMTTFEATCHATGIYPDWWKGIKYRRPVKIWACGISWGQVKEALLKKFYGPSGNPGTGLLPRDSIVATAAATGITGALESITVKHISGGNSVISFKTYEQGIRAFQGAEVDFILLDEEPPFDIYNECYVRMATIPDARLVFSFTPQMGLTQILTNLYKQADLLLDTEQLPEQALLIADAANSGDEALAREQAYSQEKFVAIVQISMYDVPWLDKEEIERIKATCPPHLVDCRIYGRVAVGEGTIYPISLDKITCEPFQIPAHYKKVYGMDVGWLCTAAVFVALDPDSDVAYVYSEHIGEQREPLYHAHSIKQRGDWIVGCMDYQANTRSAKDGERLATEYRKHGLRIVNAEKAVESGIYSVWERMVTGRLKIFTSCRRLLSEIPIYRRDDKGKIVKEHDHATDACRYAIMGLQYAKQPPIPTSFNSTSGHNNQRKYTY